VVAVAGAGCGDLEVMNTLRLRNIIRSVGIMLMLSALFSLIEGQGSLTTIDPQTNTDKLAYVSEEDDLMLYDPIFDTHTKLLDDVRSFLFSPEGRIAFRKLDENDQDVYVFDPSTPAIDPINISQNPAGTNYALAWSRDGRSLVFSMYQDEDRYALYVWNGETIINIMPDDEPDIVAGFYVSWSFDGRLTFTVRYGGSSLDIPHEIYLWDGKTTTNLSQNPEEWDGAGVWSKTGQFMFSSEQNGESNFYIWDGVSFKGNSPDVASFKPLAPELKPYGANWMDDDLIAFTLDPETSLSGKKEIILWDVERETVIQRYSVTSENAYSWLAEGGRVILSWQLASGLPSYYLDIENTEGEILFSIHTGEFAWSSDGYLAYCEYGGKGAWELKIWDGEETRVISRATYKPIAWVNGGRTLSCNNG
jgi:WD40 repeat protein